MGIRNPEKLSDAEWTEKYALLKHIREQEDKRQERFIAALYGGLGG